MRSQAQEKQTPGTKAQVTSSKKTVAQRSLNVLRLTTFGLLVAFAAVFNVRLYHEGANEYARPRLGSDVLAQLHHLRSTLKKGSATQMQEIFPEGEVFMYALYGLSYVEVALREPGDSPLHKEALAEIRYALEQLSSQRCKARYDTALMPPHGSFYVSWRAWLAGGLLLAQDEKSRAPNEVASFQADCATLAEALKTTSSPFLQSYPSQAWPVDTIIGMAALKLHDKLFPEKYATTISKWLSDAQRGIDPKTGLLAHRVDAVSGLPASGARGTSQTLSHRFLIEIDPAFAAEQYTRYRSIFTQQFMGIVPGIIEYPTGQKGSGDVDSGPLIGGFSVSATVVAISAAMAHKDFELANVFVAAGEAVGLPIHFGDSKFYGLGLVPVGDAFFLWAKTSSRWIEGSPDALSPTFPGIVHPWWRLALHAISICVLVLLWCLTFPRRT